MGQLISGASLADPVSTLALFVPECHKRIRDEVLYYRKSRKKERQAAGKDKDKNTKNNASSFEKDYLDEGLETGITTHQTLPGDEGTTCIHNTHNKQFLFGTWRPSYLY